MALPSFTITGNLFDITGDIVASELYEFPPTTLRFVFTPNLANINDVVEYNGNLYRIRPVYAGIEDDGTIVHASMVNGQVVTNGDSVKLLAEDAGLSVSGLMWRAALEAPTNSGTLWREVTSWWFYAAADGVTVDLPTVDPAVLGDGPRLVTGSFSGGDVTFVNQDGSELLPITIPAGTLVFTDNGDGTWSVG